MPTHAYRVLGVELFEPDDAVIADAIERRRSQLRSFNQGDDLEPATALLGEIDQIEQCLLDSDLRATYDASLREFVKSQQSFVVRLHDPAASGESPDLEILPDEVSHPGPTTDAWMTVDSVMVPMPTQIAEEASQRLKKKQKNIFVEFAKIIGGGIAGLLLGYLFLLWVNPDNDLFQSLGIGPNSDANQKSDPLERETNRNPFGESSFND